MKFYEAKEILNKMDFIIKMARLDIDASGVGDIPQEKAEIEIKKAYVAMRIWMIRLSEAIGMSDVPEDVGENKDMVQLSLFDDDDLPQV